MRLDKFLTQMQIGSRSEVKALVKKGVIKVNGAVIKQADYKMDENSDIVTYNGVTLTYQEFYYYMLHKPSGFVTATKDNVDQTVMDLLKDAAGKDLFPVGRLDKDTEGLLLITNDGAMAHELLSPKKHVPKTYYVVCQGQLSEAAVRTLEEGVEIGDETPTLPAKVKVCEQKENQCTMELTITEGRFHQVKRMIQSVGGEVLYLKRLSMGSLQLDKQLEKGCYRALTQTEIDALTNKASYLSMES